MRQPSALSHCQEAIAKGTVTADGVTTQSVPQRRKHCRVLATALTHTSYRKQTRHQLQKEQDYDVDILLGLRHSSLDYDQASQICSFLATKELVMLVHWLQCMTVVGTRRYSLCTD